MNTTIDISKLDKAEVLAALYNSSRQQGMGLMGQKGRLPMTKEEAQAEIDRLMAVDGGRIYFDYLHGRVMKINLGRNDLSVGLYDRDNGPGAAAEALAPLFEKATA